MTQKIWQRNEDYTKDAKVKLIFKKFRCKNHENSFQLFRALNLLSI